MARNFALRIDAKALETRAAGLATLSGEAIGEVVVTSLNEVIEQAFDRSRDRIGGYMNLADDYLRRRMRVEPATRQKPQAVLIADGSAFTSLSHYDPQQQVRDVNWSNERIQALGKTFAPWPGWTRRTGRPNVGIAVNKKGTGKSVEVARGSRKRVATGFAIAGKTDSEGNLLVFRRKKGSKKLESLLGPSVYQLFAYQLSGTLLEETEADLVDSLADAAEEAIQKALST